jgi:hypothetical protein
VTNESSFPLAFQDVSPARSAGKQILPLARRSHMLVSGVASLVIRGGRQVGFDGEDGLDDPGSIRLQNRVEKSRTDVQTVEHMEPELRRQLDAHGGAAAAVSVSIEPR